MCEICSFPIVEEKDLTVDHIIPKSQGGKDSVNNMQPAHWVCNQQKGSEWGFKLTGDTKRELYRK